jgi:RNA polymerase sigma-70 factor (ECF subfamily)
MSVNQQNGKADADHFTHLHSQYRDRLLNSMAGMVRDREAAEEITAAAFAKAFEKRDGFRGQSSLYTWIYSIALNEARQQLSRKRLVSLDALEQPPAAFIVNDHFEEMSESSAHSLKLRKALRRLPAIYRNILVDHFVRGYRTKQIARHRQIPVGTVLSRIHTGKRLLRAAWEA